MNHRSISQFLFPLAALIAVAADVQAEEIYPKSLTLPGHEGSVVAVALTQDGKTLVSGSRDDTMKVWDVATGKLKQTLTIHDGDADIYALAFSHDGSLMASGSRDTTIILWDAKTFKPLRTLRGHTDDLRSVAFSPDDKTLASAGEDDTFRLWDIGTGRLKVTRTEHTGNVKSVAYLPDGSTIVTASSDSTVRLWNAASGEPMQVLEGAQDGLEFCAVSPDGGQLFAGTGNIGQLIFWATSTGKVVRNLPNAHGNQYGKEVDSGSYMGNGRWAVSGSKDRSVKFWDAQNFKLQHSISGLPGRVESMCISADGKTLVTGFGGTDFTIAVWDLTDLIR